MTCVCRSVLICLLQQLEKASKAENALRRALAVAQEVIAVCSLSSTPVVSFLTPLLLQDQPNHRGSEATPLVPPAVTLAAIYYQGSM
jgi:hypothetical protein